MALHADGQGGHTAHDLPSVERADAGAHVFDDELADDIEQVLGTHDGTAEGIAVAVDVLGDAVHDEVGTQRQRALGGEARPGAVDRQESAMGVGQGCDGSDVADARGGIARRFDVDEFGLGRDGRPDGIEIGGVDQGRFDAKALGEVLEQHRAHGNIRNIGTDKMVATAEQRHECAIDGTDTTRCDDAIFAALEGLEALFEPALVGVHVTGVAERHGIPIAVGGQDVAVGHDQWAFDGVGGRIGLPAGVDGAGRHAGLGRDVVGHERSLFEKSVLKSV